MLRQGSRARGQGARGRVAGHEGVGSAAEGLRLQVHNEEIQYFHSIFSSLFNIFTRVQYFHQRSIFIFISVSSKNDFLFVCSPSYPVF